MLYKDIKPILYSEDAEMFEDIFENGEFSYNEPVMIDQLSMYDNRDSEEAKSIAEAFGCRIDSNGDDIWIPAGLPFSIKRGTDSYTEMVISHNGASYYPNYVDDDTDISVKLTEFGKKLNQYAKNIYTDLVSAYNNIKYIERIFGVAIIRR